MPALDVRHLGDYIREQRNTSQISLRQLARLAGVSNPYLSQIERGLRKPSAEILQQIAKALRISAEALYVQAGILEHREGGGLVPDAVFADEGLNERQKQVLLEIYDTFRKENAAQQAAPPVEPAPAPARRAASPKTSPKTSPRTSPSPAPATAPATPRAKAPARSRAARTSAPS